jgi:hypothetical protein
MRLVPVALLDDGAATHDVRKMRRQLLDLVVDADGQRRGARHVPNRDLKRSLHRIIP